MSAAPGEGAAINPPAVRISTPPTRVRVASASETNGLEGLEPSEVEELARELTNLAHRPSSHNNNRPKGDADGAHAADLGPDEDADGVNRSDGNRSDESSGTMADSLHALPSVRVDESNEDILAHLHEAEGHEVYTMNMMGQDLTVRVRKAPTYFCIPFGSPFRQFCIKYVLLNPYFDYFMIFVIVINSIIIVLNEPPEEAEYTFLAIFTVELILKTVGFGFKDYISDHWNKLDFFVVVIGYIALLPFLDSISFFRALKVFRIFRCVTAVPSLRVMVLTLGYCIYEILLVSGPILFVVVMFAIFGLQLFVGLLRNKCVCMPGLDYYNGTHGWLSSDQHYADWIQDTSHYVMDDDDNGGIQVCGNVTGSFKCPVASDQCGSFESVCLKTGMNPNDGYTNFDDFGWSILATIQIITLDFWENIYRKIIATTGAIPIVYFVCLVMFGAFFVMNILLAVVSSRYFRTKHEDEKEHLNDPHPQRLTMWNTVTDVAKWRLLFQKKIETQTFVLFINLTIIANTITMSLSHHDMSDGLSDYIYFSNYVFTSIFACEVIFKLVAYGYKDYFCYVTQPRDSVYRGTRAWNAFDFTVVCVSILEIILESSDSNGGFSGLSVIRVVRLLRILKFMSSRPGMQRLLNAIGNGLSASLPLVIIAGIVIYAFAAMGLQLFRDDYISALRNETGVYDSEYNVTLENPSGDYPRWHFIDFQHSFLMIFRILCGEWIEPLWETMNYSGKGAIVFYLLVVLIGNFVVFNLFIAVLLGAFEEEANNDRKEKASKELQKKLTRRRSMRQSTSAVTPMIRTDSMFDKDAPPPRPSSHNNNTRAAGGKVSPSHNNRDIGRDSDDVSITILGPTPPTPSLASGAATKVDSPMPTAAPATTPTDGDAVAKKDQLAVEQTPGKMPSVQSQGSVASGESKTSAFSDTSYDSLNTHAKHGQKKSGQQSTALVPGTEPLCLSVVRKYIYKVVVGTLFNLIIFICIMISSITLCFEDVHLENDEELQHTLLTMDIFFAVIFTIEFLLKLTAFGWKGYFFDGWNVLDFLLVIVSIVSLSASGYSAIKAFRVLRALRPLRAVKKWESMRTVVNSMFAAIPSLFNVLVVLTLSWLSFSIVGVQLFGGQFYKCVDRADLETMDAAIIPDKATCCAIVNGSNMTLCDVDNPAGLYYWRNSHVNFDNTLNGFMALFLVGTYEGFEGVIMDSVDSVGIDKQPIFENRFYAFYFYVLFILLGAFFALNLVVTAVIDAFQAQKAIADTKKKTEGIPFSEKQERLMLVTMAILQKRPTKMVNPPTDGLRAVAYRIAESTWFQWGVMVLIILNTITYTIKWYGMDESISQTVYYLNVAFTVLYLIEAIIKLYGLRIHYFADNWNVFDFAIVIISLINLFIDIGTGSEGESSNGVTAIFSALRIMRCLKLLRFIPRVDLVLATFTKSLSALVNVALLLFMVMFIFAIVGMNQFQHLKENGVINQLFSFSTFGNAMLLLFQLCTAAGWSDVVLACSLQPPDCDTSFGGYSNGNCGSPAVSQIYFGLYIVLMSLILVSAYIAILLEHLTDEENISNAANIPQREYDHYYKIWQKYDPDADQYIDEDDLVPFLSEIKPPLGVEKPVDAQLLLDLGIHLFVKPPDDEGEDEEMRSMQVQSDHERLQAHCADILCALVRRKIMLHEVGEDHQDILDDSAEVDKVVAEKMRKKFPSRGTRASIPILKSKALQNEAAQNLTVVKAVAKLKLAAAKARDLRESGTRKASAGFTKGRTRANTPNEHRIKELADRDAS